jgi:hypothetical protein
MSFRTPVIDAWRPSPWALSIDFFCRVIAAPVGSDTDAAFQVFIGDWREKLQRIGGDRVGVSWKLAPGSSHTLPMKRVGRMRSFAKVGGEARAPLGAVRYSTMR